MTKISSSSHLGHVVGRTYWLVRLVWVCHCAAGGEAPVMGIVN